MKHLKIKKILTYKAWIRKQGHVYAYVRNICPACEGTGAMDIEYECNYCQGTGKWEHVLWERKWMKYSATLTYQNKTRRPVNRTITILNQEGIGIEDIREVLEAHEFTGSQDYE